MAYDDRPRYISLIDMIDGGGAGRSGDTFQGGGILSALANALARPYGYEDRLRDRKNSTGRAIATVVKELNKSKSQPPVSVAQTAAMEDAYTPDYGYDYPTYAQVSPTTSTPMSDPYAYLFEGQSTPQIAPQTSPIMSALTQESFSPASDEFKSFVNIQREMEAEMGFAPKTMEELVDMYRVFKERNP